MADSKLPQVPEMAAQDMREPAYDVSVRSPYLIYLGNEPNKEMAKTAFGLRDWAADKCIGQYCSSPQAVDLGMEELDFAEAVSRGAQSLVVGLAPDGGSIPVSWHRDFTAALKSGLDIVAGMHTSLHSIPGLSDLAQARNRRLVDVRKISAPFPVASGRKRTGKRLLTVGTDCALGKKYTALTITDEMNRRRHPATFRATGQTGILIAGRGIPIDSVVSDFAAGAAETLSPDNFPDHWDIIEGQGSLFHPSYAGVSLGLLHGSQPDAIIMCHDPLRSHIDGLPDFPIPSLPVAIAHTLECARLTNPNVKCIGISLNTFGFTGRERANAIAQTEHETGLPCSDPVALGTEVFVDALKRI